MGFVSLKSFIANVMESRLLLFLSLFFFCFVQNVVEAQSYVVSVTYDSPVLKSIVRELPNSDMVSYVETETDHWIVFASTGSNQFDCHTEQITYDEKSATVICQ